MKNSTLTDERYEIDTLLLEVETRQLVLYNDDVNTFDDVIRWLIEICEHETIQAEQCAFIVHYNGKCSVKSGSWDDLQPRAVALMDKGLSVEIH
jgi:ATP-dependent Clp protease adaptor protein ClpS